MTLIIYSPKDRFLCADKLIVTINPNEPVEGRLGMTREDKIKISKKMTHAHVWLNTQHDELIPPISRYIKQYERGQRPEIKVLERLITDKYIPTTMSVGAVNGTLSLTVIFMTKRKTYMIYIRVPADTDIQVCINDITELYFMNNCIYNIAPEIFDSIPVEDLIETCFMTSNAIRSSDKTVIYAQDLKEYK